jgi:lactoylglutathione lyase
MKKMMGMMMMGLAAKVAALVPLAIGGLFLLAGKAFIISKIALVLSLIIALKKLLSQKQGGGGGHHHEMHHGWQPSGGGGGWDRRSLGEEDHAQHLAYSGQASKQQ